MLRFIKHWFRATPDVEPYVPPELGRAPIEEVVAGWDHTLHGLTALSLENPSFMDGEFEKMRWANITEYYLSLKQAVEHIRLKRPQRLELEIHRRANQYKPTLGHRYFKTSDQWPVDALPMMEMIAVLFRTHCDDIQNFTSSERGTAQWALYMWCEEYNELIKRIRKL